MKKIFFVLALAALSFTACNKDKDCPTVNTTAPTTEVENLRAYLSTNGIVATEDSRGFFYTINTATSGTKPTTCSTINFNYIVKLTNGSTVQSANNVSYPLSDLITGWKEALPFIGVGGRITLYLPPSLAYGANAQPGIPANSNLIFDITLNAVN